MWLRTEDSRGRQHVLRLDEVRFHIARRDGSCICNPRYVKGVIVHRTLLRSALYTPLKNGGH